MKKTMFTVITVMTITIFTACTKSIDRPASSANTADSKMYMDKQVNATAIIKKPSGYTGGSSTSDSILLKTTTQP